MALLAALIFLKEKCGTREVFLHQPRTGLRLKSITGTAPPRSLYTSLPKRFGFQPTEDAPAFLERPRREDLRQLCRTSGPLFWKLEFAPYP